jgi:hypothetical protein
MSTKVRLWIGTGALVIVSGLGIYIAGLFAQGNLIWAEAFSDKALWRFVLAAQPIVGIGVSVGAVGVALFRRRIRRGLLVAAIVVWVSNAISIATTVFLVVVSGGF